MADEAKLGAAFEMAFAAVNSLLAEAQIDKKSFYASGGSQRAKRMRDLALQIADAADSLVRHENARIEAKFG